MFPFRMWIRVWKTLKWRQKHQWSPKAATASLSVPSVWTVSATYVVPDCSPNRSYRRRGLEGPREEGHRASISEGFWSDSKGADGQLKEQRAAKCWFSVGTHTNTQWQETSSGSWLAQIDLPVRLSGFSSFDLLKSWIPCGSKVNWENFHKEWKCIKNKCTSNFWAGTQRIHLIFSSKYLELRAIAIFF